MVSHTLMSRNGVLRSPLSAYLMALLSACGVAVTAAEPTPSKAPVAADTTAAPTLVAVDPPPPAVPTSDATPNAQEALKRLRLGNRRFADGQLQHPCLSPARRAELAEGQHPFATIFGCVDSRVPPELVFDCGLGELFVVRTAGHVLDSASLGSIQFGVAELGIPLILVLGHGRCGAIKATIELVEKQEQAPGRIASLVEGLAPALDLAKAQAGDLVDNCVRANTELSVGALRQAPLLAEALAAGSLQVVGGRYDLGSGLVDFSVA
jgi:carbonic anhydrase